MLNTLELDSTLQSHLSIFWGSNLTRSFQKSDTSRILRQPYKTEELYVHHQAWGGCNNRLATTLNKKIEQKHLRPMLQRDMYPKVIYSMTPIPIVLIPPRGDKRQFSSYFSCPHCYRTLYGESALKRSLTPPPCSEWTGNIYIDTRVFNSTTKAKITKFRRCANLHARLTQFFNTHPSRLVFYNLESIHASYVALLCCNCPFNIQWLIITQIFRVLVQSSQHASALLDYSHFLVRIPSSLFSWGSVASDPFFLALVSCSHILGSTSLVICICTPWSSSCAF